MVQVVSFQCSLVDNQYQQKSGALYNFTLSKSYAYLLHVEPSNLVFLKTCNTEFELKSKTRVTTYEIKPTSHKIKSTS